MLKWAAVVVLTTDLLIGALLTSPMPANAAIDQRSEGACSPPMVNNSGQVTINCPGVDKEAMRYLEGKLSEEFRQLNQQISSLNDSQRTIRDLNDLNDNLHQQADGWARRYRDLAARLASDSSDSGEEDKQARALIQQGEFAKAEAILEKLAAKQEAEISRTAATQYSLGDLAMLRFDAPRALPHYAKAFRYQPDNPRYAFGYAETAHHERRYLEAEEGWTNALRLNRVLAARDPGVYRSDVAMTLNNLASLYSSTGRRADAEKAYEEALAIYRELAERDSGVYRPYVAITLNNRAILYGDTGRRANAEKAYEEALTIWRELAARDPGAYRPEVAMTLNNLAILYSDTGRRADAEKAYEEALTIYRELAARDPGAYRPDVAITLNNLALLYRQTGRSADAEKASEGALAIYRELAIDNPNTYADAVRSLNARLIELRSLK